MRPFHLFLAALFAGAAAPAALAGLVLEAGTVTPHVKSTEMRCRRAADFSLGARVHVFLRNTGDQPLSRSPETTVRLRSCTPEELLHSDDWAWHDFPGAWANQFLNLPPGALTVLSRNGKRAAWGTNTADDLMVNLPGTSSTNWLRFEIGNPQVWLSAVTILGRPNFVQPDSLIVHISNDSAAPMRIVSCRLFIIGETS